MEKINHIPYSLANMTKEHPSFPVRINMWDKAEPFFAARELSLKQIFAYLALKVV